MFQKILLVLFLWLFLFQKSNSQETYHPVYDVMQNNPKAPAMSGLFQYQKFPVNMNTGIANIDLPIYEVVDGNIKVPISISFSTGGIKVNELPTCLGIGWNLTCGGQIYQKVNGLNDLAGTEGGIPNTGTYFEPDWMNISPITNEYLTTIKGFHDYYEAAGSQSTSLNVWLARRFMGKIVDAWIDSEADEFKVNVPGFSNTIFYDQVNQKCKTSKLDGLNITYWPTDLTEVWQLKDKAGLEYHFTTPLKYKNPLHYNHRAIPSGYPMNPLDGNTIRNIYLNDNWPLGTIIDTKTSRQVSFIYSVYNTTIPSLNHGSSSYKLAIFQNQTIGLNNGLSNSIIDQHEREEAQLDEITFSTGKVQFVYYANQELSNYLGPKLIKYIKVLNSSNEQIKAYRFYYTSKSTIGQNGTIDNQNTLKFLNKITESTIFNGNEINRDLYSFEYYEDNGFPKRFSFAQDKWGYYNGFTQNTTFFPIDVIQAWNGQNAAEVGANRSVNFSYAKEGNIKAIIYPTKGRSEFEYQSNLAGNITLGGLRINKIKYRPMNGHPDIISKFEYDTSPQVIQPSFDKMNYKVVSNDESTIINISGVSHTPLSVNGSNGVFYNKVDNIIESSNNFGKTSHYFSLWGQLPYPESMTGYSTSNIDNTLAFGSMETATLTSRYNSSTQAYEIIQTSESNIVPIKSLTDYVINVQGYWSGQNQTPIPLYFAGNDPYATMYPEMNMMPVNKYYHLYSDNYLPIQKNNTQFEGGNEISSNSQYEYDLQTGAVKLQRSTNSKGDVTEVRIKYANQYTIFSNPANSWDVMLEQTLLAAPIEISTYKKLFGQSSFLLMSSKLYKYENNNLKEVYEFETDRGVSNFTVSNNTASQFVYDSRYANKFKVVTFDNNYNPLLLQDNKKTIAYIYDYSNSYPVAMVDNVDNLNNIAYSSFETNNSGNWVYTNNTVTDVNATTGKKVLNLSLGSIQKNSLNSSMTYVVSYWSNNGSKNVNSTSSQVGRTLNGYTYYEHRVSGVSSLTISGTGYIDELRLYPEKAYMTTTTYNMLVGITSQCDVNNRINYYEYDTYNRLVLIRDQDKNVVKRFCYNYAGEPEDCALSAAPSPINCNDAGVEQISVVNNAGATGLLVKYTLVSDPSVIYIFPIPSTSGVVGCLPGGKNKPYNIEIYHPGLAIYGSYTIGGLTVTGTPAYFNNLIINASTKTISIDLDF